MKGIVITLFIGLVIIPIAAMSQPERKYNRQGITYYKQAIDDSNRVDTVIMKKAIKSYQKAIEHKATSIEARFNLANAKLKMGEYQQAEREYRSLQSAITHDTIKAKIFHNLGNSQLYQGKIKESIEAYKNALRLNPGDLETKYNLAFAQSKLQQMKNQQQQNQNQNQDQNNNQDNQQSQNNNQQQQNQQQAQQQKAEENKAKEEPMKEEQNNPKDDKQKFSKEDAARILEALQNQEQKVQDKLNKQRNSRSRQRPSRDW